MTGDPAGDAWARVRTAFEAALDLPEAERIDFLANACGDDAELLRAVVHLLASDHRSIRFLVNGPGSQLRAPPPPESTRGAGAAG